MPSYRELLDSETVSFIDETAELFGSGKDDIGIDRLRANYNRLCAGFHPGRPEGVTSTDQQIDAGSHAIPIRVYSFGSHEPGDPAIVFYHGGGFAVGNLETHDDVCAGICLATGCKVIAVDYRLAPEHPHPAAANDAMAAFRWACDHFPGPLLVTGDSAGGNLAAVVSHAARRFPRSVTGQVLMYPVLGNDYSKGSFIEHAGAPMLTLADIKLYDKMRLNGAEVPDDFKFAPMVDPDLAGLPPTVVISAEYDPLRDDSREYAEAVTKAGGRAVWIDEPGLVHGFLRGRHTVSRAGESFDRMTAALVALGKGEWPY